MEVPDRLQQISEQPEANVHLPLKGEGGGESIEVINQVSVTEVNQEAQAISFKAGRVHSYINEWLTLTSDSSILDIVKGCRI